MSNLPLALRATTSQRRRIERGTGPTSSPRPPTVSPPRLHDLRHSFAVRTILDGYREGGDPTGRLSLLSTYLGHVDPGNTYWYLSAAPELLALARSLRIDDAGQIHRFDSCFPKSLENI